MRGEIKEIYGLIRIERSKWKLVRQAQIFCQCSKAKTHIFVLIVWSGMEGCRRLGCEMECDGSTHRPMWLKSCCEDYLACSHCLEDNGRFPVGRVIPQNSAVLVLNQESEDLSSHCLLYVVVIINYFLKFSSINFKLNYHY